MQATAAYYLLLDDRLRTTTGSLGTDFLEFMVSVILFSLVYQDVDCKLISTCDAINFETDDFIKKSTPIVKFEIRVSFGILIIRA